MAYGYTPPKPVAPRVNSFQVAKQTTGFREPFPSLSGQPQAKVQLPKAGAAGAAAPRVKARPPQQVQQVARPAQAQQQMAQPQVGYSYDADPVLNQIQALSGQSRENANAEALRLRKQLALDYGDETIARQYGGEEHAAAARGNPNSILAQLARSYQQGQQQLEEDYNQNNLFYSGARIKGLADFAQQYQAQQAAAAQEEQARLGDISSNLAAALHAADLQDIQAQQEAYARSLQSALAAGGTGQEEAAAAGGPSPDAGYDPYPILDFSGVTPAAAVPPPGAQTFAALAPPAGVSVAPGWTPFPVLDFSSPLPKSTRKPGATSQGFRALI